MDGIMERLMEQAIKQVKIIQKMQEQINKLKKLEEEKG